MISDYSRFKRLIVFGCSYTSYMWPTWADILSKNMPQAEFYNFGKIGCGNLFISMRISEMSRRMNFNSDDLVIVMWTSMTREDRHIDGEWRSEGNIYNQSLYPRDFVRDFCQPDFFLIRDTSLMNITKGYLQTLPCKSIFLNAWPWKSSDHIDSKTIDFYTDYIANDIQFIYEDILNTPIDLRSYVNTRLITEPNLNIGHKYINKGKMFDDHHPNPKLSGEYLQEIGFALSNDTREYILTSQEKLSKIVHEDEINSVFPDCLNDIPYQGIF